jgi:hypothetical protein
MNANMRLIRYVQGPLGSLRLYEHRRLGLATVVAAREGTTQVLELNRYEKEMLPDLMSFADEVQRGVNAGTIQKAKPKRARVRKVKIHGGGSHDDASTPRRKAGG